MFSSVSTRRRTRAETVSSCACGRSPSWSREYARTLALARVLAEAAVPYAIIGGVALQVHHTEPRTTLGID